MALQASGPISLNDVNVELGLAGTTSISMNSNIVRVLFAVPTNASSISMSNGYGKANEVTAQVTVVSGGGGGGGWYYYGAGNFGGGGNGGNGG